MDMDKIADFFKANSLDGQGVTTPDTSTHNSTVAKAALAAKEAETFLKQHQNQQQQQHQEEQEWQQQQQQGSAGQQQQQQGVMRWSSHEQQSLGVEISLEHGLADDLEQQQQHGHAVPSHGLDLGAHLLQSQMEVQPALPEQQQQQCLRAVAVSSEIETRA